MIASVGHQRVFIRSLIYKPPSAFQPMEWLPQVLKTSFSLCPLQKKLLKPFTLKFTDDVMAECCSSVKRSWYWNIILVNRFIHDVWLYHGAIKPPLWFTFDLLFLRNMFSVPEFHQQAFHLYVLQKFGVNLQFHILLLGVILGFWPLIFYCLNPNWLNYVGFSFPYDWCDHDHLHCCI